MNLNNIVEHNKPFQHWEMLNCLNENTINEISYSDIPSGDRAYDGTRAADYTGKGVDGKLRLFITKENYQNFPFLFKTINFLQDYKQMKFFSDLLNKDLSKSYVRLEIIADKEGFG